MAINLASSSTLSSFSPPYGPLALHNRFHFSPRAGHGHLFCFPGSFYVRKNLKFTCFPAQPARDVVRPEERLSRPVCVSASMVDNQLLYDMAMGVITVGGALTTLKFWDQLARRGVFSQTVSRKLVHISVGLIFMLFWPLYSDGYIGPYIAAFSPAINGLRMIAIGFRIMKDDAIVLAITRNGDPRELLRGPLYYAMTITLSTICEWRTSPLAPIIIANLCAGDGFADLIGRNFGTTRLPYNANKTYVGSLSMLVFAFIFSIGYEYFFSSFGFYPINTKLIIATFLISLVTTFVESLPISTRLDDNLTVPLTSFIVGRILL